MPGGGRRQCGKGGGVVDGVENSLFRAGAPAAPFAATAPFDRSPVCCCGWVGTPETTAPQGCQGGGLDRYEGMRLSFGDGSIRPYIPGYFNEDLFLRADHPGLRASVETQDGIEVDLVNVGLHVLLRDLDAALL